MYIIGIAGGTGSGKTTVVRKIVESLPADKVVLVPLDSYYSAAHHLSLEERKQINVDHPMAFDWELLSAHLYDLRRGIAIDQPIYSYENWDRTEETIRVEPREVIIVEGILTLYPKDLRDLMDLKIFVDTDADERLIRIIKRDIVERGRTVEETVNLYTSRKRPMHNEFVEPSKRFADLIIPEGGSNQNAIELMQNCIRHRLHLDI